MNRSDEIHFFLSNTSTGAKLWEITDEIYYKTTPQGNQNSRYDYYPYLIQQKKK